MFQDVPRFPGGGVQPVQACHQLGAGRHPRRLGQPSSGDPNLGGAVGSDPNPGPSRFYLYFWEKIFYIFRYILYIYILYIYMCDSKIFSPHHGENQWLRKLVVSPFLHSPRKATSGYQGWMQRSTCVPSLGAIWIISKSDWISCAPRRGKDGEGWWRDIDSLALQYIYIYYISTIYQQYINILLDDIYIYILTIFEDILDDEPYEAFFLGMVLRFDCKGVAPFKPQNVKIWS